MLVRSLLESFEGFRTRLWADTRQHAPWLWPYTVPILAFAVLALFLRRKRSSLRVYNPKKWWELTNMRSRRDFDTHGPDWIQAWFSENDKPIRFVVDSGYCSILPSSMADEFRKMKELCMYKFLATDFHSHLHGFDGFKEVTRDAHLATKVVLGQFQTQANKYVIPLSLKAKSAISDVMGHNKEWHTTHFYNQGLDLIVNTVEFIMVGEELSTNPEWLDISKKHALTMAVHARQLRLWSKLLRPFVHYLSPLGKNLRDQADKTRSLVEPIVRKRRAERATCLAKGVKPPVYVDSIQWFEEAANGDWYDATGAQLAMHFAGIYATSDLLIGSLVDICRHPEIIEPLRQEIRTCISEGGWTPASLFKMKLLDSCMKETQRIKPVECATMRSYALRDVTFSNGTFIPKGELVAVAADRMNNPNIWEEPEKYDPYRFMRMRQDPEKAASALLENTSADHVGFGWNPRACPGRFFAAKEVKILLAHLLIQYDFKPVPGDNLELFRHSFSVRIHPNTRLMVRRRDEELPLPVSQ
ncbi:P450 monooxygenase [Colletotrichum godetiae]|uniref:P450 monooxygenase n=1 Tax=Colletotrichum godetiae TaxID=1209918 RepID=A0AAJ0A7N4_9PEZI|nr:P450 monooxygenase [Colletotrichum godetiae]KAK1658041.1 P450 monooxygenase [Colletotrichum godetiae]